MVQLAWRFLLFQKDSALAQWTSSRGMEGSVRNPSTPGGWNGTETSPEAVHPRV
jgi:hypothetical protein